MLIELVKQTKIIKLIKSNCYTAVRSNVLYIFSLRSKINNGYSKAVKKHNKNLNYEQINKIINKTTNEVDIYFWLTMRDRVLQLSLKQVIK